MCALQSGENVEFSWTRDGHLIRPGDSRIGINFVSDVSSLTIKDVHQGDSGIYTCIAKNDVSEDRASAKLLVKGDYFVTTVN